MKTITTVSAVVLMSVFAAGAQAYQTIGKVISSERAPMQCKELRDNVTSNPVLMGIAGAAAGHQFGSGNGRKAMTVVGAVVGASVGSSNRQYNDQRMDCRNDGYINVIEYTDRYGNVLHTTRQTEYRLSNGDRLNINVR
jgi:uncharacterized protein YcfJ